jgi:hypothetical protein
MQTLGQILTLAVASLATTWREIMTVLHQARVWMVDGFSGIVEALGSFIIRILDLIPGSGLTMGGVRNLAEDMMRGADEMRAWVDSTSKTADELNAARNEFVLAFGRFLGVLPQAAQDLAAGAQGAGQAAARSRFTGEQEAAIGDWAEQVQEIERGANAQRLAATQQYEAQRTGIIQSYGLTLAREAVDFGRQRARQQAALDRSIADIREDAAARERTWQSQLNDRIADIRAEGRKRIEQIEEEGQRNLERMRRDHRVRLMEAAANLDARAVAEEQNSSDGWPLNERTCKSASTRRTQPTRNGWKRHAQPMPSASKKCVIRLLNSRPWKMRIGRSVCNGCKRTTRRNWKRWKRPSRDG